MNWKKLVVVSTVLSLSIYAQNQSTHLMAQTVDETKLVALHGTVHPLAQPQYDQGRVSDSLPMRRLLLTVARPAAREKDLQQFLQDIHSPGSPNYHRWLTPDEYGTRFGAADDDAQVVSAWLQSHGFSVARIARNKSILEFSGTAGQIRDALHTEMHQYNIQGTAYYANSSDISVPEAISSRISGFAPLNSFPLDSYVKLLGGGTMNPANHRIAPRFTITQNKVPFYAFGPEDFVTQYDVSPVYASGINGSGQTIGVIETANINLAMLAAYRQLFNLPADHTQVILDGQDPGDGIDPNIEGYLDAEVSGAIAPNATVNYYIAGGDPFEDTLALAALRAIEDNQASVLSMSYGGCEQGLGEAGNQLWAGLWQQAAAQGETVFVSSGDSGPTTCQPIGTTSSGSLQYMPSVNVNGLSSTPWNVSVGGTDFYYTDYATGALSAASFWNQTNDSSNGSLKAPLTEQPWDNSLGLDVSGAYDNSGAGGGGPSNCSQTTVPLSGALPTCIAGYPKPSWQNAPGVPNDQVRDLPDVSLFASSGVNLSAVPICGEPGDCAAVGSGYPQVTLVGGTSASSPSMAAIFALVNQKYGRQGQANFTLYALARQVPNVFHDITLGTNDIACLPGTFPDCNVSIAADRSYDSYGKYAAGPGYDMASGLGSVDVNQLISNWDKVTFEPSTTILQATPSSVVHGATVTVNVAVKANSGSAIPTGNVVLQAGPATTIPVNAPLPLTGGSASASLTNLPGGSYPLTAQYGGDGSFASSSSTPVSLTVTPEASSTALSYSESAANSLPNGQLPFGGNAIFTATPASLATKTSGFATGTVTFTDTASSVTATAALDSYGIAAWNPQNLAIGAHSITASYWGDASYKTSTSTPLALTVVKGSPSFTAVPEVQPASISSGWVYQAGSNLIVHVLLGTPGTGAAPTGTVTVNFGALQQKVTVTPNGYLNENLSTAFITFTNIAAGTYSLNASYSGDSNWNTATYAYASQLTYANAGALATTTALAITPSSVISSGSVVFNVTVQVPSRLNGAPGGIVLLYANGTVFGEIELATGSGLTASGVETIPASEIPYGSLQVMAEYLGYPGFDPSVSSPLPLTVAATDFSLSVAGKNLAVPAGQSVTVPVSLGGPSSAGVTVGLSCLPSSASISCSVSPGSANFTGTGSANLTINAFAITNMAAISQGSGCDSGQVASRNVVAVALLFLLLLPTRKRLNISMLLVFYAALALTTGCGGSSASSTSSGSPSTNAQAGSYSIVVSGVSEGITHNVTLNLTVQ